MQKRQYTYGAGQYTHKHKEPKGEDAPLPFGVAFRLRFLLCILLFVGFLLADDFVFKGEETTAVFQYLEKDTGPQEVGHCIYQSFVIK